MLSSLQIEKPLGYESDFQVDETMDFPLITVDPKKGGTTRTFLKGKKFSGVPAVCNLIAIKDGKPFAKRPVTGVIIPDNEGGHYVVPLSKCRAYEGEEETHSNIVSDLPRGGMDKVGLDYKFCKKEHSDEDSKEFKQCMSDRARGQVGLPEDSIFQGKKPFDPEEAIGFSYKQLAVIGIVGLVIVKLLK